LAYETIGPTFSQQFTVQIKFSAEKFIFHVFDRAANNFSIAQRRICQTARRTKLEFIFSRSVSRGRHGCQIFLGPNIPKLEKYNK
jgi:hypothetical protein